MPAESEHDIQFEIGHILLIDIVGYSKLLINAQREQLQTLNAIVRNTAQFRAAEASGMLVRIPTGDGMALIFRDSLEAPARCALEIGQALRSHPEIRLRMGIHSGPVSDVRDVNERNNIAGAGIDIAQRVMDCGDAGHILLSKRVADDLAPYPRWNPYLHELGECEVKHGVKLSLVNLYTDEIGNPQLPEKLKKAQEEQASAMAFGRRSTIARHKKLIIGVAILVVAALAIVFLFNFHYGFHSPSSSPSQLPAKSIAVLPFVNMSSDKENEYFVDGLTEEILNRLAQISALKVPGRTSSFAFKGKNTDLREIGTALDVAHVLEGSVRKSGDRLRITAQLVRTVDGYHLWSQSYDRKLDDVFAIQEEIARAIADALSVQLKLQPESAQPPTRDMAAYNDYLEARALIAQRDSEKLQRAISLLQSVTQRDPQFAKAWGALAQAQALAPYYLPVPVRDAEESAEAAARKALTIDDSLAAAHSALADVLRDRLDWANSEREYQRALELSPGETETHNQYAQMLMSVGHMSSALEHANRACELDPLSWVPPSIVAVIHLSRGEFGQAHEFLARSEKLVTKPTGFQIVAKLLYALSTHDSALSQQTLAAMHSSPDVVANPADRKLLETAEQALRAFNADPRSIPDLRSASTDARRNGAAASYLTFAGVAVAVNQPDVALDIFEEELRSPYIFDLPLIWVPVFQPLRTEPRFKELVKETNLPEYWRVAGWGDFCRAKGANDFECAP